MQLKVKQADTLIGTFHMVDSWDDFTLEKGIELSTICKQIPPKLKELYDLKAEKQTDKVKELYNHKFNKLTDRELIKTFPMFYGKVLRCLSDMPQRTVNKCLWEFRHAVYTEYLEKYVIGVMYAPYDIELKDVESFEHKGVKYYLPKSRLKMGQNVPMADAQVLEFTEAADLQLFSKDTEAGQLTYAANIISILARPKGEEYDEEVSLKRAEEFMQLPMRTVLNVFFSSIEHFNIYYQSTLQSGISKELEAQRHLKNRGLKGLVGTLLDKKLHRKESLTSRALRLYNQSKGQTYMTSFTTWLQKGQSANSK